MSEARRDWVIPVLPEVAEQLTVNTEQLGTYLVQMGQLMIRMQKRLDEMESQQARITASHDEVKQLGTLIRLRAAEYCEDYGITDPKDVTAVRVAIKKAVLQRYGVKDLHDCPQIALGAIQSQINRWADIRMVMKIREKHREDGA